MKAITMTVGNLRAIVFEDLLALKMDLEKAAKRFQIRCLTTEQLFKSSAKKLSSIINYRKDDQFLVATFKEIGNALALHSATAILEEASKEASVFSHRMLGLLPEGTVTQLKLFQ